MRRITNNRRRAGHTLVELLIASVVLLLVLGGVALVGKANDQAYRTGFSAATLEAQATAALDRVAQELQLAAQDTLDPVAVAPVGTEWVQYSQVVDFVAGAPVITGLRRLEFVYETGELDDGLDNNGNGLVDEGRLELTLDVGEASERRLVLTRWVAELQDGELPNGVDDNGNGLIDEPGFHVVRVGGMDSNTYQVRLSLQRQDGQGFLLRRTSETSVLLRNQAQ